MVSVWHTDTKNTLPADTIDIFFSSGSGDGGDGSSGVNSGGV
jgi:hypothetical protein